MLRKKLKRVTHSQAHRVHPVDPWEAAEAFVEDAAAMNLQRIDEAAAVTRPSNVEDFYVENYFDAKAAEQPRLWAAEGELASRDPAVEAAGLEKSAAELDRLRERKQEIAAEIEERNGVAARGLRPHTRRARGERTRYYATMGGLLGGDVAGVAGAAIMLGETIELAVAQAVASGVAAITSGLIGGDVKDFVRKRARARPVTELTDDEKPFAHHFAGPRGEEAIIRLVGLLAIVLCILIGSAVASLRFSTEGATAAMAFGFLALGISIASFLNSFAYADEIADLLDSFDAELRREEQKLRELIGHPIRRRHAAAKALAASIVAEFHERGVAATEAVKAAKAWALVANPGVVGHGRAADRRGRRPSAHDVLRDAVGDGAAPSPTASRNGARNGSRSKR